MIKDIVDTFYTLAKEHIMIKSFAYNSTNEIGEGNEKYPLLWLEEPIYASITGSNGNIVEYTINFSITLIPSTDLNVLECQNKAMSAGINIIEKIKNTLDGYEVLNDWNVMTLRHYYDNDSAGCRFTMHLNTVNETDRCINDLQFDVNKEFDSASTINNFDVSPKSDCETFNNKLVDFDINI